jgi:membrane-bound metal-dependent hydrolase YbcI (DUF457 family)
MPNLNEHLAIGSAAGAGTYMIMCKYYRRNVDLGELLLCTGVGTVCGIAPDVFEPAIHPHHRAFGHSLALSACLAKFAATFCTKENGNWQQFQKILAAVAIVSYLAHLFADALTPRCLPVV